MARKIQIAEPPPRHAVEVLSNVHLGDGIYALRLQSPFSDWKPGDCIAVYDGEGRGISRPYSLCGSTSDSELELWVRQFPGGQVSEFLCGCRSGDRIQVSPPFGYFRPAEPRTADKLYFATGTGIAPFLSAIRSGAAQPREVYWGLRQPLEKMPDFPLNIFLSQSQHPEWRTGRISHILSEVNFTEATHVYACGLDRMIEEVLGYFSSQGLAESQLHRECFFTSNL
ncbi:FAD-binding oxidoreductase [Kiritimatiellaeota bacterium B1221]|nr:FAD-binding oxidoreductase [Kiritimatiellaeota bacterium B1221]